MLPKAKRWTVRIPSLGRPPPSHAGILVLGLLFGLLAPVAVAEVLRVAVISDLNGSYGSIEYDTNVDRAMDRILKEHPDLVISTGDMVAGQRSALLGRPRLERMWQAFHNRVSERLAGAGIPLAVTPGNHDASIYKKFRLERTIYGEQWRSRRPSVRFVDDSGYPFHYAFAMGSVLFVSVDATGTGRLPGEQMVWLRRVLEERGPEYRQRVLFSHLPLWPVAKGREREHIGEPELQKVLEENSVDIYLSGHHHAFYPGSKGGVGFVAQACLGAGPRRLLGTGQRTPRAYTLLRFADQGIGLAAYSGASFDTAIDWATLPERLRSAAGELTRADLTSGRVRPLGAPAAGTP